MAYGELLCAGIGIERGLAEACDDPNLIGVRTASSFVLKRITTSGFLFFRSGSGAQVSEGR